MSNSNGDQGIEIAKEKETTMVATVITETENQDNQITELKAQENSSEDVRERVVPLKIQLPIEEGDNSVCTSIWIK